MWAVGLAVGVVYIPWVNGLFDLQPLTAEIWKEVLIIIGIFVVVWGGLSAFMKRSAKFHKWEDAE